MPLVRGSALPHPLDYLRQLDPASPLMPYFDALENHLSWDNHLPVASIPTTLNKSLLWGILENRTPFIAFSLFTKPWVEEESSAAPYLLPWQCKPITNVIHTVDGQLNETHEIPGLSLLDIDQIKGLIHGNSLKHSHPSWPQSYEISLVKPDYFTHVRSLSLSPPARLRTL